MKRRETWLKGQVADPVGQPKAIATAQPSKSQYRHLHLPGIITLLGIMGGVSCFTSQPGVAQQIPPGVMENIRNYCVYAYGEGNTQSYRDCENQYSQQQITCQSFSAEERTIPELQEFCKPPSRPVAASLFGEPAEGRAGNPALYQEGCSIGEECPRRNRTPVSVSPGIVRTWGNDPYLRRACASLPESRYQQLVAAKPTLRQLCQSFRPTQPAPSTSGRGSGGGSGGRFRGSGGTVRY